MERSWRKLTVLFQHIHQRPIGTLTTPWVLLTVFQCTWERSSTHRPAMDLLLHTLSKKLDDFNKCIVNKKDDQLIIQRRLRKIERFWRHVQEYQGIVAIRIFPARASNLQGVTSRATSSRFKTQSLNILRCKDTFPRKKQLSQYLKVCWKKSTRAHLNHQRDSHSTSKATADTLLAFIHLPSLDSLS